MENVPNTATAGLTRGGFNPGGVGTVWLGDGSSTTGMNAFINELRDHDAVIEGHYRMTYLGGDPINTPAASYTKMFISYNPAGRETGEAGTVAMAPMTGWLGQSAKRTATF